MWPVERGGGISNHRHTWSVTVPEPELWARVTQGQHRANGKRPRVVLQALDEAAAAPSLGNTQQPNDDDSSTSFRGCA